MKQQSFLVYDSGMGGRFLFEKLNNLNVQKDLFTDEENFPYGEKTLKELEIIALRNFKKFEKKYEKIIVACNSLSIAIEKSKLLKNYLKEKIIKITDWVGFMREEIKNLKSILIIATNFTINSNYYRDKIKKINKKIKIFQIATPKLVEGIEKKIEKYIDEEIDFLVNFIKKNQVESLILGCTHFSVVKKKIQIRRPSLKIFDPTEIIINRLF